MTIFKTLTIKSLKEIEFVIIDHYDGKILIFTLYLKMGKSHFLIHTFIHKFISFFPFLASPTHTHVRPNTQDIVNPNFFTC